ncbi:NmrA family transcriptional regulator [Catellatospora methionotrophica]|uniref:NmrA family transcriptional regulator n=1 Tax=Catellatospora methionotrophica TaxID=121620 RepID=A0A8J3LEF7_9ACTN|nr:NmrA family NAD(P)-binding protein [Catellatospora methionotrophica]GIG16798.1 NmrA family transcriptional regulator [Catellatospora methionotrophica]
MAGRVLVSGASGTIGKVVAATLAAADVEALAASRTGGPVAGCEGVVLDFTRPSTWPAAFKGVESLFLMRPPAVGNVRRDLLPAVAAAGEAGVRHVVFLSLQGAERNKIVPHSAVERWLRASRMTWTFVRPSFFCQNLTGVHLSDIRDRDQIAVPAGDGATAFVDALDVGEVAAAALLDTAHHAGRTWTVTGPRALTYQQIAWLLSAECGRTIRYTRPGLLAYTRHARTRLGMPWPMVAVTSAIYTTARLGMAAGLSDDVRTVLGRDPIDFTQFAHRERDLFNPRST